MNGTSDELWNNSFVGRGKFNDLILPVKYTMKYHGFLKKFQALPEVAAMPAMEKKGYVIRWAKVTLPY
jgi:hypothetical protein